MLPAYTEENSPVLRSIPFNRNNASSCAPCIQTAFSGRILNEKISGATSKPSKLVQPFSQDRSRCFDKFLYARDPALNRHYVLAIHLKILVDGFFSVSHEGRHLENDFAEECSMQGMVEQIQIAGSG